MRGVFLDLASLAEQDLDCGAIVRTVAEGADKEALAADLRYSLKLWAVVKERCSKRSVKSLVHEDLSLPLRILRDMVTSDVERVLVDPHGQFADEVRVRRDLRVGLAQGSAHRMRPARGSRDHAA